MTETIRVVIADDHQAVRSGVATILATDPTISVVAEVEDGFSAVEACTKYSPDVALVDLRMPGTDGIWATERITSHTDTRVLVLTTYDSDELVAEALAAGAHGYLLKSASGPELVQAVRHVAQFHHVIDPAVAGGIIERLVAVKALPHSGMRQAPLHKALTEREQEVLELVATGMTNQAIADHLNIGVTTVKTHIASLYSKTGVTSRVELGQLMLM